MNISDIKEHSHGVKKECQNEKKCVTYKRGFIGGFGQYFQKCLISNVKIIKSAEAT